VRVEGPAVGRTGTFSASGGRYAEQFYGKCGGPWPTAVRLSRPVHANGAALR
jgi:hypothetical protein